VTTTRLGRWQSWVTIGAAAACLLVLINIVLFEMNRGLQAEVNSRQQYIQQSLQLEALNREIVAAIANLAVRNKDDQLKALLAQHGITINVGPAGSPAPSSSSGTPAPGRR
jgi:hypothetical protein